MDLAQQRAEAERALRRGDLKAAVAGYGALVKAAPEDAAIVQRFLAIREMIQQGELTSAKAAAPRDEGEAGLASQAEAAAGRGELAQALALYRRAVEEQPENQLFLERMGELLGQLKRQPGSNARAVALKGPGAARPLPADPVACLTELLARITRNRRRTP